MLKSENSRLPGENSLGKEREECLADFTVYKIEKIHETMSILKVHLTRFDVPGVLEVVWFNTPR
jgi:hypothetical protein